MAEKLKQELWRDRWQKLENLTRAPPGQQQPVVNLRLYEAAKKDDVDGFIQALVDHCARERVSLPVLLELRSPSKNTLLHAAAESDDNVKAIIRFIPDQLISCKNCLGETPLHIAARAGKAGAVELLLERADPTCTDHSGNSPLHEAVTNCHYEVSGNSPPHEAVRNRRYEVIRQLLSADPNPLYRQNKGSMSPWCLAVETGDQKVLEILLEAPNEGEDQRRLESESVFGMSPVHVAIMHKDMDMLNLMLEKKPWLFQLRDSGNGTPLHLAAYINYLEGARFLIEKFPTSALEQDSKDGYLPIHLACMMDHVKIVKELLRQWPDPAEFLTRLGQNILHVSAQHGSIAIVKYILKDPKFGPLINARDIDGNTPLHLAALHCQCTVGHLAQDRRVDLGLVDNNNMTALDLVEQMKTSDDLVGKVRPFAFYSQRMTQMMLSHVRAPRNRELAICASIGRSPQKRLEPLKPDKLKDHVNTILVVAALIASVTFAAGFTVPGGFNVSGTSTLLHKVMYNVFVIGNFIAMYSSVMAIMSLLSTLGNEEVAEFPILLAKRLLWVALFAMPLVFLAGVYMTVTKFKRLSSFVLISGSVVLYYSWTIVWGLSGWLGIGTAFFWDEPRTTRHRASIGTGPLENVIFRLIMYSGVYSSFFRLFCRK